MTSSGASATANAGLTRLAAFLICGLEVLTAVWLAWAPPESIAAPWRSLAWIALSSAAVAGVIALLAAHRSASAWLLVPAALIPFLGLLWVREEYRLGGPWTVLEVAALSASLAAVAARRLWVQVVLLAGVMGLMVESLLVNANDFNVFHNPTGVGLSMARVATLALAATAMARRLRSSAREIDDGRARLRRTRLALERRLARDRADDQLRAAIHDTVLNTLEAAAAGVPPDQAAALRRRCREDLRRVSEELSSDRATCETLADVVDRWRERGLRIDLLSRGNGEPPAEVTATIAAAADEALRNIHKHAGTDDVAVFSLVTSEAVTTSIVDRGSGFDTDRVEPGVGVNDSIHARLHGVGGRARITSRRDRGTRVDLIWPAADPATPAEATERPGRLDLFPSLRRGLGLLTIVTALTALAALVVAHASQAAATWLVVGLGAALASTVWTLMSARSGAVTALHAAVAVAVSAVAPWAVALGQQHCSPATQSALPLDGRILPLLVMLALAPRVTWWAAGITVTLVSSLLLWGVWARVEASCGSEQLTVWAVLFLTSTGALLLGRLVRDQQAAADVLADAQLNHQLAVQSHQASRAARISWQGPALSAALGELEAIASAGPGPTDADTVSRRQSIAARLRATVLADRVHGDGGHLLRALVKSAGDREQPITVRLTGCDPPPMPEGTAEAVARSAHDWNSGVPRPLEITVSGSPGQGSILLMRTPGTGPEARIRIGDGAELVNVETWCDVDAAYWLADWQAGSTAAPGRAATADAQWRV